MPVTKIDPKIIFASDAPSQDQPAVFSNKPTGWGVSRQNGGRPTIKQANGVQQDTDIKILWLNENAVLPYDASLDYPVNAVTIKDGVFKIFNGTVWNLFLDKTSVGLGNVDNTSDSSKPISTATQTALNLKANQTFVDTELAKKADKLVTYTKVDVDGLLELKADLNIVKKGIGNIYSPTLTYSINERVILTNGDVVKSIVNGNTNNPNTNMVGWSLDSLTPSKNLADLPNVSVARDNLGVYSEAEVDAIFAGATTTPDATETVAGKAKIATTAIAQAGTNDTDFLTPLKTIPLIGGVGQAYKDVKATRALGTTYTNPNTKPIWIYVDSVRGSNGGLNFRVTITPTSGTSVTWLTQFISTQYICQGCTGWVMIPPKASYLIGFGDTTYTQVNNWLEIS